MKPWQTWVVTVSVALMAVLNLLSFIEVHVGMAIFAKGLEDGQKRFDADLKKMNEQAGFEMPSLPKLPKSPSGRVIVNPPQR